MSTDVPPRLLDTLQTVLAEPALSMHWWRLGQALLAEPDTDLRGAVVRGVLRAAPENGLPGFHRAMLAAHCDLGEEYLRAGTELVLRHPAWPASRGQALLSLIWHRAMRQGVSRSAFVACARACGMPSLALHLQQQVVGACRPVSRRPRQVGRVPRVTVLLTETGPARHPPTQVALQHAAALLRAGYLVQVVSAFEWQIPDLSLWLGLPSPWRPLPSPQPDLADWRVALGDALESGSTLQVTLADLSLSPLHRAQVLERHVDEFDPDWVVLIGLTSYLAQVMYSRYPIVGMSTLSVPPMAPLDVWLSPTYPARPVVTPWHSFMPVGQVVPRQLRLAADPGPAAVALTGLEINPALPQDSVVVLSAGGRLHNELPRDWLAQWKQFLSTHPEVIWLLVGTDAEIVGLNSLIPSGQVRRMGFVSDLPGLLNHVHIVANPPRLGGGTSVAMAMAAGVPVVSYGDCDGGDKVAHWGVADDTAYFARLSLWVRDVQARAVAGQAMRELYLLRPDDSRMAKDFLSTGALACELFKQRCTIKDLA